MALIFEVNFEGTLRKWVASEDCDTACFNLNFTRLEDKIRKLFHLTHTTSLVLTYVDKEGDVITLGNDEDLVDACLIQHLNPLHLDVHEKLCAQEGTSEVSTSSMDNANIESVPKAYSSSPSFEQVRQIASSNHLLSPKQRTDDVHDACHPGIKCDGCAMVPIKGPRFKSKKTANYDLCFSCFDLMGTMADFQKLDYPETKCSRGFFGFALQSIPARSPSIRSFHTPECPFSGQDLEICPLNWQPKSVDARFVDDVTVLDGTQLESGTKFTKTWRMQNNGTVPWPQTTRLACIGGSKMTLMEVVDLELPRGGLPCGQVIDISIEMEAPSRVGHYMSHWRLVLPSNELFGDTVWIKIHVNHREEVEKVSVQEPSPTSCILEDSQSCSVASPEENKRSGVSEMDIELNALSLSGKPAGSHLSRGVEIDHLDTQRKILESSDLANQNSNLLRLKETNASTQMQATNVRVDAGWEDKIAFLKDLGLTDRATNMDLLRKHNGSIKLVVKDLVKLEKQSKRIDP